jgi:phospholipid/cholesterol/gamma-HCH transport system permease protein
MLGALLALLQAVGAYVRFCGRAALAAPRMDTVELRAQARGMVASSILVVAAVAAFAGAMLTVQGFASLKAFGTPEMLGMFVAMAGVREVFPLICAGCVGAKVGSAMAAEMATLRLGQQLDALEVMAVDPLRHLVAPRMLATLVVTPVLVAAGTLMGLFASYLTAVLQLGVDPGAFVHRLLESMAVRDLGAGVVKALAFGALTGTLGCWHGWRVPGGAQSVGRAANHTVVQTMMMGAVLNLLISTAFYGRLA